MEFIVCNFFTIFLQNILINGFPLVSNSCSRCEEFYGTSKLKYSGVGYKTFNVKVVNVFVTCHHTDFRYES